MRKKSDVVFMLLALAVATLLGYLFGTGEGRRGVANQCVFAQEFIVGGRYFICEEATSVEEEPVSL